MGKAASSAASCSPLSRFATGDALITAMNDPTVLVSPSVMCSRRRLRSHSTRPHCYHSCIIHTHHSCARPAASALSHKRSSPFQGPTAACACPKSPPQGCRIPILGRSVTTYFRYADTYAGRPRLSSLVSRRVRMPTALSASVSNVPYNHPNHTISNPTPNPVPKSHHPGRLESCSPPSAVSHPLGRRPLTPPLDS